MDPNWNDNQPIYRQLRDQMVALILEGRAKEGDPLPSVRAVAADYRLNPLTVLKGYQQLVDENLVEKRRGRGMYVSEGARRLLLAGERERFLKEDWPQILAVIQPTRSRRRNYSRKHRAHPPGTAAPRQPAHGRMRLTMAPLIGSSRSDEKVRRPLRWIAPTSRSRQAASSDSSDPMAPARPALCAPF